MLTMPCIIKHDMHKSQAGICCDNVYQLCESSDGKLSLSCGDGDDAEDGGDGGDGDAAEDGGDGDDAEDGGDGGDGGNGGNGVDGVAMLMVMGMVVMVLLIVMLVDTWYWGKGACVGNIALQYE